MTEKIKALLHRVKKPVEINFEPAFEDDGILVIKEPCSRNMETVPVPVCMFLHGILLERELEEFSYDDEAYLFDNRERGSDNNPTVFTYVEVRKRVVTIVDIPIVNPDYRCIKTYWTFEGREPWNGYTVTPNRLKRLRSSFNLGPYGYLGDVIN